MLQDKDFDEITQAIVNIYQDMEMELLIDVAQRFNSYKTIGGSLAWYIDMLKSMNVLDEAAVKIIAKYSKRSEAYIRKALKDAQLGNFNSFDIDEAFQQGFTAVTYEQLIKNPFIQDIFDNTYKEVNDSLRLIQTKALQGHKQAYIDVLNKAYIDVASGAYSYDQSIRDGIKKMAKKGITGVTYKRKDGTLVNYSMEAAVRRETLSATHKIANETTMQSIKAMGANYVDVSSHLGARVSLDNPIANHAGWQGKQYQLEGSSEKYPIFIEKTGYGDIQGFGGVNCRHRMFAFFPGISKPYMMQYDEAENREYYENTQKLRKLERQMRSLKKQRNCLNEIEDEDSVAKLNKKIKEKSKAIDEFCKHTGLIRDHTREVIGDV